jgi:hypothetical protein
MSNYDPEAQRTEAELLRHERESSRHSAELERAAAELSRTAAEQTRVDAETIRRGAVSELQSTAAALTVLIERMEKVEAMRRASGPVGR